MNQQMLAIWSLVPLPFLNPAWTSGKFTVHILLKPGLENFEHYFASVWDECNCAVVWGFFGIAFLWDWNENWPSPPSPSPVATAEFSEFADILSAALSQHHLLGFEIAQLEFHHLHYLCSQWCFLRPTWLHIPGCLALGEWSHHHDYLGREDKVSTAAQGGCTALQQLRRDTPRPGSEKPQ